MKKLLALCAITLALCTTPALANHKNAECVLPEEVLDDVQPRIPVELKLVKFDRFDALRYIGAMFALTGGGKPPFDLSKVKGGVIIYSPKWPLVYAGVIDGPGGVICHARGIPMQLHRQILKAIEKGKA